MIKINISNITKNKLEEYHFNAIYNGLRKKKSIEKFINSEFGLTFKLKDFLIGNQDKTLEIVKSYETFNDIKKDKIKEKFEYFINQYEQKLSSTDNKTKNYYKHKGEKYNAYFLCKELNINVCPYCNKNYMITISDTTNDIFTRPTLDHFFAKAEYPFLALSLYNLIPSCHICNSHIKKSKAFHIDTHIHPYFDDFNKIKKFNIDKKLLSLVNKDDEFNIIFENKNGITINEETKANNHIKDFALESLYNSHKDKVIELIDISRAYNEASFENLVNEFVKSTQIFKDKNDVKRLMLCHHVEDENIDKRPLNKLIKDISEELGIL
ncbi:hypothetical protein [Aliarcobacter butzleri]|uniref:hypothetical protein n=1 Tax=Aliarcobacter butzleri TaxID=28197 RepID=UPI0024DE6648|nr:hypothetical protein [Aliarcobacter butzleri]MDK2091428.1 hypothetical protein [Aliarcobacter butzleri]